MGRVLVAHVIAMVIGLAGCALAQESDSSSGSDGPAAADFDQPEVTRFAPNVIDACDPQAYCTTAGAAGASFCQRGGQNTFCCPRGYSVAGGSCIPNCGRDLSCGWNPAPGATVCSQSYSNTTQTTPIYCCAYEKEYAASGCHI